MRYTIVLNRNNSTLIRVKLSQNAGLSTACPVRLFRRPSIMYVKGFHFNSVAMVPEAGRVYTTGVMYISNVKAAFLNFEKSGSIISNGIRITPADTRVTIVTNIIGTNQIMDRVGATLKKNIRKITIKSLKSILYSTLKYVRMIKASLEKFTLVTILMLALNSFIAPARLSVMSDHIMVPTNTNTGYGMFVSAEDTTPVPLRKIHISAVLIVGKSAHRKPR